MAEIVPGTRLLVRMTNGLRNSQRRDWAPGRCLSVQGYRVKVRMDSGLEFTSTKNDVVVQPEGAQPNVSL